MRSLREDVRATPSRPTRPVRVTSPRLPLALLLLVVMLSSWLVPARAEPPPTITGTVRDTDGSPIVGAEIFSSTGEHALTDPDGAFAIAVGAWSTLTLTITAAGYESKTVTTDVRARVDVRLRASAAEVIEVRARAPEQTKPTAYDLTAADIRTMPGAGNDALRAIQSLPGVARIPFSFGGLVLRGASPRDSVVLLDGVEVPIAFHFGGLVAFYPSGMLDELAVTAGGFDVSTGRAQGGLVSLTTRAPRGDRWRLGGELGLLHSRAEAEGPLPRGGALLVGVRRSYLDAVVRPFAPSDTPLPSYLDAQVRTQWGSPTGRGVIAPMVFGSLDQISDDETAFTSTFWRIAAPYRVTRGDTTVRATPWVGLDRFAFEEVDSGGPDESITRNSWRGGVRGELQRQLRWGTVRLGLDGAGNHAGPATLAFDDPDEDPPEAEAPQRWLDLGLWADARVEFGRHATGETPPYAIRPGVRVDRYGLSDEFVLDLRLNAHQRLSPTTTLRQAVGRFHQPPTSGDLAPRYGNPALDSSYTDQASLGVEADLPLAIRASATAYLHLGHGLPVLADDPRFDGDEAEFEVTGLGPTFAELLEKQLGVSAYRERAGRSRSYGLELMARREVGRVRMLGAYTFARARRTDSPERYADGWRPYLLDQTHNLHLMAGIQLARWTLGAKLSVASGNPYQRTQFTVAIPGMPPIRDRGFGRLPLFYSLDVRAERRWRKAHGDLTFFIDVQNATLHRNVEAYEGAFETVDSGGNFSNDVFRVDDVIRGLPILPMLGVEYVPR